MDNDIPTLSNIRETSEPRNVDTDISSCLFENSSSLQYCTFNTVSINNINAINNDVLIPPSTWLCERIDNNEEAFMIPKHVTCCVCQELYFFHVDSMKPVIFECNHDVCVNCYKKLDNKSYKKCPLCRTKIKPPRQQTLPKKFLRVRGADSCLIHNKRFRKYCKSDKEELCESCEFLHVDHDMAALEDCPLSIPMKKRRFNESTTSLIKTNEETLKNYNISTKQCYLETTNALNAITSIIRNISRNYVQQHTRKSKVVQTTLEIYKKDSLEVLTKSLTKDDADESCHLKTYENKTKLMLDNHAREETLNRNKIALDIHNAIHFFTTSLLKLQLEDVSSKTHDIYTKLVTINIPASITITIDQSSICLTKFEENQPKETIVHVDELKNTTTLIIHSLPDSIEFDIGIFINTLFQVSPLLKRMEILISTKLVDWYECLLGSILNFIPRLTHFYLALQEQRIETDSIDYFTNIIFKNPKNLETFSVNFLRSTNVGEFITSLSKCFLPKLNTVTLDISQTALKSSALVNFLNSLPSLRKLTIIQSEIITFNHAHYFDLGNLKLHTQLESLHLNLSNYKYNIDEIQLICNSITNLTQYNLQEFTLNLSKTSFTEDPLRYICKILTEKCPNLRRFDLDMSNSHINAISFNEICTYFDKTLCNKQSSYINDYKYQFKRYCS